MSIQMLKDGYFLGRPHLIEHKTMLSQHWICDLTNEKGPQGGIWKAWSLYNALWIWPSAGEIYNGTNCEIWKRPPKIFSKSKDNSHNKFSRKKIFACNFFLAIIFTPTNCVPWKLGKSFCTICEISKPHNFGIFCLILGIFFVEISIFLAG